MARADLDMSLCLCQISDACRTDLEPRDPNALFHAKQMAKVRYTRRGINDFLFSRLASFQRGDRIMFVGAGGQIELDLRQFLRARGLSNAEVQETIVTVGIDPATEPIIRADLSHQNILPRQSVEWLLMMEVFYAVRDPQNALREVYAALKPGVRDADRRKLSRRQLHSSSTQLFC